MPFLEVLAKMHVQIIATGGGGGDQQIFSQQPIAEVVSIFITNLS